MRTKQLIFLVTCFLFFKNVQAQQDTLEITPRELADSVYGELSASNIPSGRLFNRMFIADSISFVDHFQPNSSDTASADFFYGTLNELRSMSYDSSTFIYPNTIFLQAQGAYGTYEFDEDQVVIPLGIIDYTYQSLDETSGLIQQTNLQFFDNGVSSFSAFSTKHVQMIAPMYDFVSDDIMYFLIKEDWVLTDNEESIQSLEINTGNGWSTFNFDELVGFVPQNTETQNISVRLTYANGEVISSILMLHTPGLSTPREKSTFSCDLGGNLSDNSGNTLKWCLLYGCQEGADPYILDKPYILVTGYRPPIFGQKFKKTYKIYDKYQNGYITLLRAMGFDVFLVKFNLNNNSNQTIEDEADLLARFINEYVNLNRADYYENIIQGSSMGASVTRLALMKMEYNHLYDNGPNPHTREFIAFDANFYGANLPLSYQYLIYSHFYVNTTPPVLGVISDFLGFYLYNVLEQKATKELLMYHALGSTGSDKPFPYNFFAQHDVIPTNHSYRDGYLYNLSLYDTHQKFIPLPVSIRNVAVSLGKINTTDDVNPPANTNFNTAGEFWMNIHIGLFKNYLKSAKYTTGGDYFKLFERKTSLLFFGIPFVISHQRMSVMNMQEIDNASGSYLGSVGNAVSVADFSFYGAGGGNRYFSHKPVVTALAINKNLWPSSGSMTMDMQGLNLMYQDRNISQHPQSNFYGYPNVGRPADHFDITPFEAIYIDNEIDPHINLKKSNSDFKDSLNQFLISEIQPNTLGLQNWQLGGHARTDYEYIAKRVAHVINVGTDVTPVTDKGPYTIEPNAYLILEACDAINFEPGFSTEWGAQMDAHIASTNCNCTPYNINLGINTNNSAKSRKQLLDSRSENTNSTPMANLSGTNETTGIKVYPNPTTGSFTIQTDETTKIESVQLFNSGGRLTYERQLREPTNSLELNEQLTKGLYWLTVKTEKQIVHSKIIIQ